MSMRYGEGGLTFTVAGRGRGRESNSFRLDDKSLNAQKQCTSLENPSGKRR